MKNLNEKDIRKAIQNLLKEKYEGGYFDEFEFDNGAKQAAMADIQSSGEEFEELGSSKFEKGSDFKEKFKSSLKQANLGLSSDEQEVERLAQSIKKKKAHEKKFGVGSMNELDFPELMKQFKDNMEKEMTPKTPSNETPEEKKKRIDTELARLKAKELERQKEAGEIEESNIRSHANGRGQNLKPKNFPKPFKREALREEYDFAGEEVAFNNQQNFEDEMDQEVYFVVDNDFNKVHYPDLIGQTFDTPPSYAQVKLVKRGESIDTPRTLGDNDVQENSSDSLMNAHGENAKPETLDEVTDTERYEQVVYLDGQEADHALNILMQDGKDEAMEYLKQWHNPGQGMGSDEIGSGSQDKTYEKDGYIMSWNSSLGYIGLVHDTEYGKDLDEDSLTKRHLAGQREKTVPLGQHAPHSQQAKK